MKDYSHSKDDKSLFDKHSNDKQQDNKVSQGKFKILTNNNIGKRKLQKHMEIIKRKRQFYQQNNKIR